MSPDYPTSPSVTIVGIGTELTTGKVRDAHGVVLSSLCNELGLTVTRIVQVPDTLSVVSDLARYVTVNDLILITGGLGPTADDLSREIISSLTRRRLRFHADLWDSIVGRFKTHPPAPSNRKQAEIPEGFTPIRNPNGTAPGFYGYYGRALIVVMPGPPRELKPMCDDFLRPFLADVFGCETREQTTLTSFLIPESSLEEALVKARIGNVRWRTRAEGDRIVFSLSGGTEEERSGVVSALVDELGPLCLVPGDTHAGTEFVNALIESEKRVVLAESCTGGLIAKNLTDVSGSSKVFWGSLVTYDNAAKQSLLDVSSLEQCGAVSSEVAGEMAEGALAVSGVDIALAVTGIAGPTGGTLEKPVGTVHLAVATADGVTRRYACAFSGDRTRIRTRTAVAAILFGRGVIEEMDIDSGSIWNYI